MNLDPSAFVAEPELLETLWKHSIALNCAEGRKLFSQGDDPTGLFLLILGQATMILEDERGTPLMLTPMAPGSLLGLPAMVSEMPYSMTAMAGKGAKVGFITRDEFSSLMLSEPLLALMIVRVLAAEVRTTRVAFSEAISERPTAPRRRRPRKVSMQGSRS
jgi:CRP-like cAMP-binding protein